MLDAPVAVSNAGTRVEISESRPRAIKPLREFRATFFPVLDDLTNDGREGCSDGTIP
jgi:hypothetical protein